jgi:hypothetical protein
MKKTVAGLWVVVLMTAGTLGAHHSLSQFDTTTPVRVRGVIVRFDQVNPHSIVYVDETTPDGQVLRWAVEGPSVRQLGRMEIDWREAFKAGEAIEACGYVSRAGVQSGRSSAPVLLAAEEVVLSSGESCPWEDYGHHECLGPDYGDIHSR